MEISYNNVNVSKLIETFTSFERNTNTYISREEGVE
ncbi:Uncharacterised protein [Lederbergia lenta]|uniref:Uncharacterized protein n=1 Tax=Lederbergia lenta TaxID=1467 RepID=A0A2X4VZQ3_LEDLE|nr:Uncharacterised protein [Lederbergia lenta]